MELRIKYSLLFLFLGIQSLFTQDLDVTGKVSFITSDHIYVRFNSTEKISVGDTLFFIEKPCLKVSKKSTTSCVCFSIDDCYVEKNDLITYRKAAVKTIPEEIIEEEQIPNVPGAEIEGSIKTDKAVKNVEFQEKIDSRISLAGYSSLNEGENNDRHQAVARLSLNAKNIRNSRLSMESYLNYRQLFSSLSFPTNDHSSSLRLYNLSISYDIDSSMILSVGRKINRNIASIGAIDGLQFEKKWGHFITGAVAGFRPDIADYGFNADLLEYGAFTGYQYKNQALYSRTTLGLMEQRNARATDRRYLHVQSIQNIGRNLFLFASMEMDLFSAIDGNISNSPRLTNLYLSSRYRFNRKLSLTLSYDNRKRIIYYETYRTEIEKLLADDEARQGIRLRVAFRPIPYINAGIALSRRFQNNSENKSDNINTYLTFSRWPLKNGSLSLRYNHNQSNYLKSDIISTSYSFYTFKNKLNTQLYYRVADYSYLSSENRSMQHYYGANVYLKLTKTLRLGIMGEVSSRQEDRNYRINTKLIKRFRKK